MTVWYVHRRDDNSIGSAHEEMQPGYAEEALDDATNPEIQAYRAKVTAQSGTADSLIERRIADLEKDPADLGKQIEALKLRLSLVQGA